MINPEWEGAVTFYELVFGTWLSYVFLVVMWEKILRAPLEEWRYILITLFGAGAFWINHYFQYAEFYSTLLNIYTAVFLLMWFIYAVKPQKNRSLAWKVGATFTAVIFTIAFILFENIARYGVEQNGIHEFWFMLIAFFGFVGIILWRGQFKSSR